MTDVSDQATPEVPQPPGVNISPPPHFWTKKRVVTAIVVAVLLVAGACGCIGLVTWRMVATEAESMAPMREFIDADYPGYAVVDSTRSGYILQSDEYEELRLDVRFEKEGQLSAWDGPPREDLDDGWSTPETFFRHDEGMPVDPRTQMNYDVAGFVEAYGPLRPGPNAVVSAVWLEGIDASGMESYTVLVARRNREGSYVESMWPDHQATFTRDSDTGEWTGSAFEPVEIPNPNR